MNLRHKVREHLDSTRAVLRRLYRASRWPLGRLGTAWKSLVRVFTGPALEALYVMLGLGLIYGAAYGSALGLGNARAVGSPRFGGAPSEL